MVLESSIRTSALPRRQQSDRGLRVTQHAYFLIIIHTKQLLLVTFCQPTAGIRASFRMDGRKMDGGRIDKKTAEGQTDVEVEIVAKTFPLNPFFPTVHGKEARLQQLLELPSCTLLQLLILATCQRNAYFCQTFCNNRS